MFDGLMTRLRSDVTKRLSEEEFPAENPADLMAQLPPEIIEAMRAAQAQEAAAQEPELVGATPSSPVAPPPEGDGRAGQPLRMPVAADIDPNDPSTWGKVGRNDACPCGSGKKYKHCHGKIG